MPWHRLALTAPDWAGGNDSSWVSAPSWHPRVTDSFKEHGTFKQNVPLLSLRTRTALKTSLKTSLYLVYFASPNLSNVRMFLELNPSLNWSSSRPPQNVASGHVQQSRGDGKAVSCTCKFKSSDVRRCRRCRRCVNSLLFPVNSYPFTWLSLMMKSQVVVKLPFPA